MSDSVLDGDAKSVASCLFGLSEDSHWYNIHAAVHRLDVGSVFSVRFMAIPGQPIFLVRYLLVLLQAVYFAFNFLHLSSH
jgi:hypothetical protein